MTGESHILARVVERRAVEVAFEAHEVGGVCLHFLGVGEVELCAAVAGELLHEEILAGVVFRSKPVDRLAVDSDFVYIEGQSHCAPLCHVLASVDSLVGGERNGHCCFVAVFEAGFLGVLAEYDVAHIFTHIVFYASRELHILVVINHDIRIGLAHRYVARCRTVDIQSHCGFGDYIALRAHYFGKRGHGAVGVPLAVEIIHAVDVAYHIGRAGVGSTRKNEVVRTGGVAGLEFVVNIYSLAGADTDCVARRTDAVDKEISLAIEVVAGVGDIVNNFLPVAAYGSTFELH